MRELRQPRRFVWGMDKVCALCILHATLLPPSPRKSQGEGQEGRCNVDLHVLDPP